MRAENDKFPTPQQNKTKTLSGMKHDLHCDYPHPCEQLLRR